MKQALTILLVFITFNLLIAEDFQYEVTVYADDTKTDSDSLNKKNTEKQQDEKPFVEIVKDYTLNDGLFSFYVNSKNEVLMEIKPEQLEKYFLLSLSRKQGDGSFFGSGDTLWDKLFLIKKIGNRIFFFEKNVNYRADQDSAISKAIGDHIPSSIIGSAQIKSLPHPEKGSFLIDPNSIFIRDNAYVNYVFTNYYKANYNLDKETSFFGKIKTFPMNSEIDVVLHFTSNNPQYSSTIPDGRSILHTYRYSLIQLPESDYKPRFNDDRLGYFNTIYVDYNSLLAEDAYVRYINRWNLKKTNPDKKLSEPEKPIVYWLDNRIPPEYRDAVREGVLEWNKAFEKIGFKDAIVVKQMPDDADWDPEDIRYSTIQWIVEPDAGYAVGPSRINPFTGEIFDADVKLCADVIRYDYSNYKFLVFPSLDKNIVEKFPFLDKSPNQELFKIFPDQLMGNTLNGKQIVDYDRLFNFNDKFRNHFTFGYSLLEVRNIFSSEIDLKGFVFEALKSLVVHEVGHTLGLRHNFKASAMRTNAEMQNASLTDKDGLTSSVMDYLITNIAGEGEQQGQYFQTSLGAYDYWVIEYGYKELNKENPEDELKELEKTASQSTKPEYAYGTDEDASWGNRSIDPTCTRWDMGSDILKFCNDRIVLANELFSKIEKHFLQKGEKYSDLRRGFYTALNQYWTALEASVKFIGGVYQYRDHIGDPNGRAPYRIVETEKQREAVDFVCKSFLSKNSFNFPHEILDKITYSKEESFNWSTWESTRLDFAVTDLVEVYQYYAVNELYDYLRLKRLQDNELKIANQSNGYLMNELFDRIDSEIWYELDQNESVSIFRRNLQNLHTDKLIEISLNKYSLYPQDAVNLSRGSLKNLKNKIESNLKNYSLDRFTTVHYENIDSKITAVLEARYNIN